MGIKSIAEIVWRQVYPNPSDEASITLEEFIQSAKVEYAYQMLLFYWKEKRDEGSFELPSHLLSEGSIDVVNDEADISGLNIFEGFPSELWLQNIGGVGCECKYIKSTVNRSQLMCEDDSLPDTSKTYYVVKDKIKFPLGVHSNKLPIIYAGMGEGVDGDIDIDDSIAALVRQRLNDLYLGKIPKEDVTNNSNSDI